MAGFIPYRGCGKVKTCIVKSSSVVVSGDMVKWDAGYVDLATASGRIYGCALNSDSVTGDGTKTVPVLVPVDDSLGFYNDADGDLAQVQIGTFYTLLAASDQISQSTTSATAGQMRLIEIDPHGDADDSKGVFVIVAKTDNAFAIT